MLCKKANANPVLTISFTLRFHITKIGYWYCCAATPTLWRTHSLIKCRSPLKTHIFDLTYPKWPKGFVPMLTTRYVSTELVKQIIALFRPVNMFHLVNLHMVLIRLNISMHTHMKTESYVHMHSRRRACAITVTAASAQTNTHTQSSKLARTYANSRACTNKIDANNNTNITIYN